MEPSLTIGAVLPDRRSRGTLTSAATEPGRDLADPVLQHALDIADYDLPANATVTGKTSLPCSSIDNRAFQPQ